MVRKRIAGDLIGPGDFEPTGLYAVHTDDKPGDNAGAPMQETMVCGHCLPTWGGAAIQVAEGADDEPEHLVLTEVTSYEGGFDGDDCNYHYPGEFDAGAPAGIAERGW